MKANIKPRKIEGRKKVGRPKSCRRCIHLQYGVVFLDRTGTSVGIYTFHVRYCECFDLILKVREDKPMAVPAPECWDSNCKSCDFCGIGTDARDEQLFCVKNRNRGLKKCPKFARRR